jgi:hypothetical protein
LVSKRKNLKKFKFHLNLKKAAVLYMKAHVYLR